MTTLLIADHDGTSLTAHTARALSAALQLGAPVELLVAGHDSAAIAAEAAALAGVARVRHADDAALGAGLAETLAGLIVGLTGEYDAIVAAATSAGRALLPRVAALLDVAQISDVIAVEGQRRFRRPIYAGNAIETVETSEKKLVLTVRGTAFAPAGMQAPAPIEAVTVPALADAGTRLVGRQSEESDRPELGTARIVVSGGRSLGSRERFDELVLPLADALGAAVGATRAAVDQGYAPNDWQVGQTGKMVAPDLYIAAGISGAIQHVAGISGARVIVAINSDPEAPIFEVADIALVADLFTALPELTEAIRRRG